MRLRLVHLYADLMSLYGDRGNIIALQRRCAWFRRQINCIMPALSWRIIAAWVNRSGSVFMGGRRERSGIIAHWSMFCEKPDQHRWLRSWSVLSQKLRR